MNKILYLISIFFSATTFSQIILDKPEISSRTVSDPRAVIFSNGFEAKSSIVSPFVAKIGASSGMTPINPNTSTAGDTNPTGEASMPAGTYFHDSKGNLEVTNGGQLQFTFPIALPPGVKTVAPQINLVYSSGSSNGIAGYGFSLSGLTSISRIAKNFEKDGKVEGIKLDYTDYYQLNGQRLILKSGEYGKNGAEYYTEKHSNIKIKSIGAISGHAYQGPEYWEVTFEDGSQALYGVGNAKTPVEYNICKWKDVHGNYITYNYLSSNNVANISSIEWGGNETLGKPHFNKIDFGYISRLKELAYINGIKFIQEFLLQEVVVRTNGQLFKRYLVEYAATGANNYAFVKTITEQNSQAQPSTPVSFQYEQSVTSEWENAPLIENDNNRVIGDFDGDGNLGYLKWYDAHQDCIRYSTVENEHGIPRRVCAEWASRPAGIKLYRNFIQGNFPAQNLSNDLSEPVTKEDLRTAIAISFIKDNKSSSKQGLLVYRRIPIAGSQKKDTKILVYAIENNSLKLQYSKMMPASEYDNTEIITYSDQHGEYYSKNISSSIKDLKEVDVDGDGISEIVFQIVDDVVTTVRETISDGDVLNRVQSSNSNNGYQFQYTTSHSFDYSSIVADITQNTSSQDSFSKYNYLNFQFDKAGDFNGDGKTDYINVVSGANFYLTEFTRDANTKKYLGTTSPYIGNNVYFYGDQDGIRLGDFNGDGKTDLIAPIAQRNKDWKLYISTGKGFEAHYLSNFYDYLPFDSCKYTDGCTDSSGYPADQTRVISYTVADLNKDGKSELIIMNNFVRWRPENAGDFSDLNIHIFSPVFNGNNYNLNQTYYKYFSHNDLMYDYALIAGDFRLNQRINKLMLIGKERLNRPAICLGLSYYDITKLSRINQINQGGITTDVDYKEINPTINPELYQPVKKENFPFVELDRMPNSFVVSQLRQVGRKQDFLYRGLIANVQGRGVVGFRKTARTSWYANGFENTKIWSATEIDPINFGVPIKEWTTKDYATLFSDNINVSNTQLLSLNETEYETKYFLNGTEVSKPVGPTLNVVLATVPKKTTQKDFLKDVTTVTTVDYNSFFLPTSKVSTINNGFATTTTTLEYVHNPSGVGRDYYIGRVTKKTEATSVYGDTKSSKEEYNYSNHSLDKIKKFNFDNSQFVLETYKTDGFGNITEKTLTNSQDSQTETVKSEYDTKGRFVIKKTDNLGLSTIFTYNDWGQVLTQTDPLGNRVTNTYDAWGKLLKSNHNLSGTTTYRYEKLQTAEGGIKTVQQNPDESRTETFVNKKGEQYQVIVKGFQNGNLVSKSTEYDALGRKTKESEPYFVNLETPKWNVISYDDSVYPSKVTVTSFNGKKIETRIEGRTTIVQEQNGYNRVTKKVTDAIGNVISREDKGGVINFTYNAAGLNTSATYGQNVVTTSYDTWGRKTQFHDPSNGLYKYEYDGFGQLKKEISPKGYKQYTYNSLGQLENQKEESNDGIATKKNITYTYDSKGTLIEKSGTANGKSFTTYITYDANGRVIASGEEANNRNFLRKNVMYDDKGRVTSYEKILYSSGNTTKVTIENIYSPWSGELAQVKDKNTGKILWELQESKANGQTRKAKLGAVAISNVYDVNDFLQSVNHTVESKPKVLGLTYAFNAIKNELNTRTRNDAFTINEQFTYDDNNRLINWTNPKTGQLSSNVYDEKGRIVENDQLGTVSFKTDKIYQAGKVTLNAAGTQNWDNNITQLISYNENNDPIFINGERGDVRFEYGLTEMRQMATYGGNFDTDKCGKFTKYYSEDGSYEVVVDNTTGQEKHLMYIGGNPYESNIVLVKNFTEQTAKFVFLHKDYLTTVLAVTDENGNVLESRHFDAWGILTNGTMSLIDRGYTSHEHFAEVGIIHMNGRLYDPLMRRFLNADENIQDPNNTQCYNKFGYAVNNPLLYNDPSGEVIPFLAAVAIGAAVGLLSYTVGVLVQRGNLDNWKIGDALKATFWGAVSGAVTFGIGSMFSSTAGVATQLATKLGKFGTALVQAGCHAVSQGALATMQGGDFLSGAASGFLGSLGASGWSAAAGKFASSTVGTIGFGALSGGIGAELAGGNFWQGAISGGIVSGLNHAMHKSMITRKDPPNKYARYFRSLLRATLGGWKTDLAAYAITHQSRHLFGPDAIAVSGNGNAGIGACVKIERGALIVLNGKDSGQAYQYDDLGAGVTGASASANVSVTKLYYSGNSNFSHNVFMGTRYELNFGFDVGIGLGLTGIYAPLNNGRFVIGIGGSVGFGVSATVFDFNLNFGTTSRTTPWKN